MIELYTLALLYVFFVKVCHVISHTMVHCMSFKMLYSSPTFAQPLGFDHEKTNEPISTKLSQDLGSCLNLVNFTSNKSFIQSDAALLHNIM